MVPVVAAPGGGKRVTMTSGRKVRITRTTSASTAVVPPDGERLLEALRVAEIDRPGEKLPPAVDPPGGEQLLRPDHADGVPCSGPIRFCPPSPRVIER